MFVGLFDIFVSIPLLRRGSQRYSTPFRTFLIRNYFLSFSIQSLIICCFMKNPSLRVMRTENDNLSAPEYADNLLVVEILFPELPAGTTELSVRICSADYELMGSGTWQDSSQRKNPKIRLNVCSEKEWKMGDYQVFVYRNGCPLWYASGFLVLGFEEWKRMPLQSLEEEPDRRYFAEKLCLSEWWTKIHQFTFQTDFIREIIRKLRLHAEKKHPDPHWLVVCEDTKGKALASVLLPRHFGDNRLNERYVLPLEELVSGAIQWERLNTEIGRNRVVVVRIPELAYNDRTVNLLSLFASLLQDGHFGDVGFIFQGTEKAVKELRQQCTRMDALFAEEQTFRVQTDGIQETIARLEGQYDETLYSEWEDPSERSAEEELNRLVGLRRLKEDMEEARMMALFLKERKELCLEQRGESRHHMLFLGNPGTGKTTVARLVGQIYHRMGLLSKGHTVITCRTNLVGEYIGHTEKRMKEVLEEARGGVLFIDEAYTLVSHEQESNDYGKEVIHALLTVLSEPNPDMIIILAGYEDKMKNLLRMNPGLKDRFPLQFHFDDYSSDELLEIAHRTLKDRNFALTPEADRCLKDLIEKASARRDEHFGNGRWVHNLIEQGLIKSMARRVMSRFSPAVAGRELFSTIELSDVEDAGRRFLSTREARLTPPAPRIGFRA